jgi:hypothetical protein
MRVADRALPDGEISGRNRVISVVRQQINAAVSLLRFCASFDETRNPWDVDKT